MLCDFCKENEATLHFTKVINGKVEKKNLCEECAYNESFIGSDSPFSMHKLFASIIDGLQGDSLEAEELICENCGLEYSRFKQIGKFGCSNCYLAFEEKLDPLFKGVQGDIYHRGKIPRNRFEEVKFNKEKENLEDRLKRAVETEEYELAAVIRDKIRDLEESRNLEGEKND